MAHWVSTVLRSQHSHKKLGRAAHRPVTPVLCWVETERLLGFMGRVQTAVHVGPHAFAHRVIDNPLPLLIWKVTGI